MNKCFLVALTALASGTVAAAESAYVAALDDSPQTVVYFEKSFGADRDVQTPALAFGLRLEQTSPDVGQTATGRLNYRNTVPISDLRLTVDGDYLVNLNGATMLDSTGEAASSDSPWLTGILLTVGAIVTACAMDVRPCEDDDEAPPVVEPPDGEGNPET